MGEVAVARWLGHSSPVITLGYYAHFMPEAGSKGRTAIDGPLGRQGDLYASTKLPRFSPGLMTGNSRSWVPSRPTVDCKVNEVDGLRKC